MAAKKSNKSKKNKGKKKPSYATLTLANVKALAASLMEVADRYPTTFRTEVDFYPLVVAFLSWKLRGLRAEAPADGKQAIDFKVGGTTNPAYLELAVAPRALGDLESTKTKLPNKTQLYATANESEMKKLSTRGGGTKGRFLLLVDLRKTPHKDLEAKYQTIAKKLPGGNLVNVVYAHRALKKCEVYKIKNEEAAKKAKAKKAKAKAKKAKKAKKK